MSDQDFVKELFLAYAKQGYKPRRCRELVQSALSSYSKVEIPKGVYLPPRVNIHRGGPGLPEGFIRFNDPEITPQAADEFRKEYKKYYAGIDPADKDSKSKQSVHVFYTNSGDTNEDIDAPVSVRFLKYTNNFQIPPTEEKVDTPTQEAVDKFSETLMPYSEQVKSLEQAGMYGPLRKYKEGAKPWSELAGKLPDNSLDATEKEVLEQRYDDKPENFHTGGLDNFAPVEREEEDESYNPYCEIRFKGKSKFNGDEWEGYYVYSPTTGKHYIVQDVMESIDGISTCLSAFDEIDPSTLIYSLTGTALEPEATLVPPLDSEDTVPRRGVSVTMSSAHMRPLHGMGEWTPVVINGYVMLAYMDGEGKWLFGFEEYAKLSDIMKTRHPVRSVGAYTHCMALNV